MVIIVIFTNQWAINMIWENKKGTLPVVQNNMIIQRAEIPQSNSAKQAVMSPAAESTVNPLINVPCSRVYCEHTDYTIRNPPIKGINGGPLYSVLLMKGVLVLFDSFSLLMD